MHQEQGTRCKENGEDKEVQEGRCYPAQTAEANRERQVENSSNAIIRLPPLSTLMHKSQQ